MAAAFQLLRKSNHGIQVPCASERQNTEVKGSSASQHVGPRRTRLCTRFCLRCGFVQRLTLLLRFRVSPQPVHSPTAANCPVREVRGYESSNREASSASLLTQAELAPQS